MSVYKKKLKRALMFQVCYGFLVENDIFTAREIRIDEPDMPLWLQVIAGANPEKLDMVQAVAREELGHELLGTDAEGGE